MLKNKISFSGTLLKTEYFRVINKTGIMTYKTNRKEWKCVSKSGEAPILNSLFNQSKYLMKSMVCKMVLIKLIIYYQKKLKNLCLMNFVIILSNCKGGFSHVEVEPS